MKTLISSVFPLFANVCPNLPDVQIPDFTLLINLRKSSDMTDNCLLVRKTTNRADPETPTIGSKMYDSSTIPIFIETGK